MDPREFEIQVKRLESGLEGAHEGAIAALSMVLDLKDLKTGRYAAQLSRWAVRVGEHLGMGDGALRDLEIASLLYDIGKIGVPDRILLKPDKLTDAEYREVKKHPEYGWGILRSISGFRRAALLVLHHQERWDGTGYPAGLRGREIPLGSRVIAVVDALEAMLSDRPYRRGFCPSEVIERLKPQAGRQFDPRVVEEFMVVAGWNLPEMSSVGQPPVRYRSQRSDRAFDLMALRAATAVT